PPAGMVPVKAVVPLDPPEAEKYSTFQPARSMASSVGLNSSIKSLTNGAPEFPPPPKTSLMTTLSPSGVACAAGIAMVVREVDATAASAKVRKRRADEAGFGEEDINRKSLFR